MVAAVLGPAGADPDPRADDLEPPASTHPLPEQETFALANGLRVAIVPWSGLPLVRVYVYYPSSPLFEATGQEGIAHLLEHLMMFASSRDHPDGGLPRAFQLATCRTTGVTEPRHTQYQNLAIPEFLPDVLRIEASRMGALEPTREEFEREKNIVLEEIASRSFYSPKRDLWGAVHRASFPGHPMERPDRGSLESVGSLRREDLDAYVRDYHGPTGAALVVTGDVDVTETRARIEDLFGPIPANAKDPPAAPALPDVVGGITVEMDRFDLEGYYTTLGFRLPRRTDTDRLLGFLTKELLEEGSRTAGFYVKPYEYFLDVSMFWSYRERQAPAPDHDVRRAYARMWELVHDRIDADLASDRFESFRHRGLKKLKAHFKDPGAISAWTAQSLLHDEPIGWMSAFDSLAATIDRERMLEYVDTQLRPERAVFGVVHGRDSGRVRDLPSPRTLGGVAHDDASHTDPLDPGALRRALEVYRRHGFATIDADTLTNGQPVWWVPLTGGRYAILGGLRTFRALDDERKGRRRGLTWSYDWLLAGAQLPAADDDLPTPPELSIDVTPSQFSFHVKSAPSRFTSATQALRTVLDGEPDVDRWRRLFHSFDVTLSARHRRASVRATEFRLATLFPEESAAGGHGPPRPEEAARLEYEHVRKLHESLTEPRGTGLFVIGPASVRDSRAGLDEAFGRSNWKDRKKQQPIESDLAGVRGEVFAEFQRQDVEIVLAFAPVPIERNVSDAWTRWMLARTAVRTRLLGRLRVEEGLVYSLFVTYRWIADSIVAEIRTAARPDDAVRAFEILREELHDLAAEGLDEEEIAHARLVLLKERARWTTSSAQAAATLEWMLRFGDVPTDPWTRILDADTAEPNAAMRAWLDPDRFVFTVSGPIVEEEIVRFAP